MTIFQTMYDVELANRQRGDHFFDASTKRFFASRIGTELFGHKYFVTSEQFVGSGGYHAPRMYTVRIANPDGSIDTVGEFQQYTSGAAARRAILKLLGLVTV